MIAVRDLSFRGNIIDFEDKLILDINKIDRLRNSSNILCLLSFYLFARNINMLDLLIFIDIFQIFIFLDLKLSAFWYFFVLYHEVHRSGKYLSVDFDFYLLKIRACGCVLELLLRLKSNMGCCSTFYAFRKGLKSDGKELSRHLCCEPAPERNLYPLCYPEYWNSHYWRLNKLSSFHWRENKLMPLEIAG